MDSTLENSTSDGEWTVVVSRKARGDSKKALVADLERLKPRKDLEERRTPNPRPNPRRGQEEKRTQNPRRVQEEKRTQNPRCGQEETKTPNPRQGPQEERRTQNPRRGQEETKTPNPRQSPQEGGKEQQWKPKPLNPERQGKLLQKMESAIWKFRRSNFYTTFLNQLKSPAVSEQFRLLLGPQTHLPMVIYGLGRLEQHRDADSRIQLSIALSMKREFNWIGDIQIFDPILSATECSILEILGCTVLSMNEAYALREAIKPTLFFMPQCSPSLYSNILQANLRKDGLSKIALLGKSFKSYKEEDDDDEASSSNGPRYQSAFQQIIDARRRITREFAIEQASGEFGAFSDLSWQFFSPGVDNDTELPVWDYGLFPPLIK